MKLGRALGAGCLFAVLSLPTVGAAEKIAEPTRIVIECEDMQGVDQRHFGTGRGWRVGRWGHDLYQNMTYGGVWASRLRTAMSDAGPARASAYRDIEIPTAGTYKVWAKYEAPPFYNYPFTISLEALSGKRVRVFEREYGLLDSLKHYSFNKELTSGNLFWGWGLDHDAAEGYEVALAPGPYRVTLAKTPGPAVGAAPVGARSVDAILITSQLSTLSTSQATQYPLLDELRRANHVYFRFRNLSKQPARIVWNHWNHRYPDFLQPAYREQVRFYDAVGSPLTAPNASGDWPEPVAPGAVSVWYDLGPTMNVESTSPFIVKALPVAATDANVDGTTTSLPVEVDMALQPRADAIVKSFALATGETELTFLVQPDLHRAEGVAGTRKIRDIYADVARQLERVPRVGPVPRRLMISGSTSGMRGIGKVAADFEVQQQFRLALGLNTVEGNTFNRAYLQQAVEWRKTRAPLIERSLAYWHSQDPADVAARIKRDGLEPFFHYLSYGDETGLPAIDTNDPARVAAFVEFVKSHGETPETLGVAGWDQVRPKTDAAQQKRLFWYTHLFRIEAGTKEFAAKTAQLKALLGSQVETTVNLGGEHPYYWMPQSGFIDSFKSGATSLGISADYNYPQPEASRLVVDFTAAYMRKGTSYNGQRMMYYATSHWPGNNATMLLQNAVLLWGQNAKDLNFYDIGPDAFFSENYVAYRGGLPTWKAIRTISGMAGGIEDDLLPAQPVAAPVAMLLSESSDVWEVEGKSQWDIKPGSVATNISQEERKNIWYALRHAGYRVDFVTEADVEAGYLSKYKVLYVCGQNLTRGAAANISEWVRQGGGAIFATAGAARRDEFDEPLTALDEVLGRGPQLGYQRYRGALRSKLELPFEKPLDTVRLEGGAAMPALCSREEFDAAPNASVRGRYGNGVAAFTVRRWANEGTAYFIGTLPGQAFLQRALPKVPTTKGGPDDNAGHFEPANFDPVARAIILQPLVERGIAPDVVCDRPGIVTNRLESNRSIVLTVVDLSEQRLGRPRSVKVTVRGVAELPRRVWSARSPRSVPFMYSNGQLTITLSALQAADVVVVSR